MPAFAITVLVNEADADGAESIRARVANIFNPPLTIAPLGVCVAQVSDADLTAAE